MGALRDWQRGRRVNGVGWRQRGGADGLLTGVIVSAFVIFCLSLGIALWVAYDRWAALPRFCLLLGSFVFVGHSSWRSDNQGACQSAQRLARIATSCSWLAGGIALFSLLTHDWQVAFTQDFQPLPWMTAWVQRVRPQIADADWLIPLHLHENAVAGALMILLPLGGASLYTQWQRGRRLGYLAEGGALGVAAFALLLTFSRGAWLGLSIALVVVYLTTRREHGGFAAYWAVGCGVVLMGAGVITFVITPALLPWAMRLVRWSGSDGIAANRLTLWQDAVTLVGDYWFTGSGLQSTAMVLSSYVYLLHVPYLAHGHNFYLQLALEQGGPALLAFAILTGAILWRGRHLLKKHTDGHYNVGVGNVGVGNVGVGATMALLALLLHGWVDAELYNSYLAPLIFIPLGCLGATRGAVQDAPRQPLANRAHQWPLVLGATLPLLIIIAIAGSLGLPELYLVNRATVAQTRMELAIYQWPTWPLQDSVRRHFPTEFAAIRALYGRALQQNPQNAAAQRRLGQILLAQAAYGPAQFHLAHAYQLAPQQRATRQLVGEVYALAGDATAAHRLWQTVDLTQGQLTLRIEWYLQEGDLKPGLQLAKVVHSMTSVME